MRRFKVFGFVEGLKVIHMIRATSKEAAAARFERAYSKKNVQILSIDALRG